MASEFAYISASAYKVLKKILPGPYTIILPSHKNLHKLLQDTRTTVGIRIPDHPLITSLCTKLQSPILSSSLQHDNHSCSGWQIIESYGYLLDIVLDLKNTITYKETTILDLSCDNMQIVRQGCGKIEIIGQ